MECSGIISACLPKDSNVSAVIGPIAAAADSERILFPSVSPNISMAFMTVDELVKMLPEGLLKGYEKPAKKQMPG